MHRLVHQTPEGGCAAYDWIPDVMQSYAPCNWGLHDKYARVREAPPVLQ